jgi:hypothetical protein
MCPRKSALGLLRVQNLLADKPRKDLAGEDLSKTRVVDPRDLVEDTFLVHSALGHQRMEMREKQLDKIRTFAFSGLQLF